MSEHQRDVAEPELSRVVVRRLIAAPPDRVFSAWTEPEHLLRWWGPDGVTLADVRVDLRVGGCYRLDNQYADGSVTRIAGEFEVIERPSRLVYTWAHQPITRDTEHTRVTVVFEPCADGTEVVVTHEGFQTERSRHAHATGWSECLNRLQLSDPLRN